jgi:hypothetical protein
MHHHDRVRIGTSLWVTPYSVTPFPCRPGDRDAPREAGSTRGAGRVKRVQRVQEMTDDAHQGPQKGSGLPQTAGV